MIHAFQKKSKQGIKTPKHDIDLVECSCHCIAIAQIALDEFRLFINPSRFSTAMGLRLKIIQRTYLPPFAHEKIHQMRTDEPGGTCD